MNTFIWNGTCENEIFNIKMNLIKQNYQTDYTLTGEMDSSLKKMKLYIYSPSSFIDLYQTAFMSFICGAQNW